jgi:hypothetical protein
MPPAEAIVAAPDTLPAIMETLPQADSFLIESPQPTPLDSITLAPEESVLIDLPIDTLAKQTLELPVVIDSLLVPESPPVIQVSDSLGLQPDEMVPDSSMAPAIPTIDSGQPKNVDEPVSGNDTAPKNETPPAENNTSKSNSNT